MKSLFLCNSACAAFRAMLASSMLLCLVGMLEAQAPKTPPQTDAQKKAAQAQAQAQKLAKDALLRQEADSLRTAYVYLALANTNYAGHKGTAMREVQAALTLLDANAMKPLNERIRAMQQVNTLVNSKLYAAGLAADSNELQAISDAKVATAGRTLGGLAQVMAANKQPKLLGYVQNAIKEIQAAPKHDAADAMVKGQAAYVLTSAYILLASANHDYNGYRAKAMAKLKKAANQLEAGILDRGTVEQKTKALQDANAQLIARVKANLEPTISEPQVISDAQLLLADSLIQRVASYLHPTLQKSVLSDLSGAHTEIGIALRIR